MMQHQWTVKQLMDLGLVFFIFCSPEDDTLKEYVDSAVRLGVLDFIVLGPRGADKIVAFADEIQPSGQHLLMMDDNITRIGIFNGAVLQGLTRIQFSELCCLSTTCLLWLSV